MTYNTNFEMKPITTKQSMYCIVCGAGHKTGEIVPMQFKYFGRGHGWSSRIVCDGDCLAEFAESEAAPVDKLLNKLSVQFN